MALINKEAFEAVVELGYPSSKSETHWVGTGILYADELEQHSDGSVASIKPFVFTNRHVLDDITENSECYSIRFQTFSGESKIVSYPLRDSVGNLIWLGHFDPDADVAVLN